jgi:hypothetical protein
LAAFAVGCGMQPTPGPLPVEGRRAEVDALVGRWSGAYWIPGQGRRGTLRFELRPGADTAFGEVEMSFARSLRLYGEEALTVFGGEISGDWITGTFTSRREGQDSVALRGEWSAERH